MTARGLAVIVTLFLLDFTSLSVGGVACARLALITSRMVGSVLNGAPFERCTVFFVARAAKISLIPGFSMSYVSLSTSSCG